MTAPPPLKIRPMLYQDVTSCANLVASAFRRRDGFVPERYRSQIIIPRLMANLEGRGVDHVETLVADKPGVGVVGMGQFARSRMAASAWELMLGAVLPEFQGQGIGHRLVTSRLKLIYCAGGGLVLVSTKDIQRWQRYDFLPMLANPVTGITMMIGQVLP